MVAAGIHWGSDGSPLGEDGLVADYHHSAPDKAFFAVDHVVLKKVIAKHSFLEGRWKIRAVYTQREPAHQGAVGSSNQKVLPFPTSLCTPIRPPWASTANLQNVSPRPVE